MRGTSASATASTTACIHYCLGAALARQEAEVALSALFRRFPDIALDGEPQWDANPLMVRMSQLPVILHKELDAAVRPGRSLRAGPAPAPPGHPPPRTAPASPRRSGPGKDRVGTTAFTQEFLVSETAPHTSDSLSELRDHASISRTCTMSAWLADRRDWAAFPKVFAEEVDLDYTSLNGGEPLRLPRQSLLDGWTVALGGLDATQHLVSNHLVTLNGDTAECTASVLATHILANDQGDPIWTVGGHYLYNLVRTEDGWRISGLTMTADWTSGNRDIMVLATQNQPQHIREWKHENAPQ